MSLFNENGAFLLKSAIFIKMEHFYRLGTFSPPAASPGGLPRGPRGVHGGIRGKAKGWTSRAVGEVAPHCLGHGRGRGESVRRARACPCGDDRSSIDTRVATETKTTTTCSWRERRRQAIRLPAKPSHFRRKPRRPESPRIPTVSFIQT